MPKKIHSKESILQASLDLFDRKGRHTVSMRDISAELHTGPSTIYNHFSSKEAIFEAIIDEFRQEVMEKGWNQDSVNGESSLCQGLLKGFAQFQKHLRPQDRLVARVLLNERFTSLEASDACEEFFYRRPKAFFFQILIDRYPEIPFAEHYAKILRDVFASFSLRGLEWEAHKKDPADLFLELQSTLTIIESTIEMQQEF